MRRKHGRGINCLDGNPPVKDVKMAGDLDTNNGKFTNLSGEEIADLFCAAVCGKLPQQQEAQQKRI